MDTRVDVPLLPMMAQHQKQNMRDHLAAVQQIVAAIAANDFDGIARAAATIGYSEQMGRMCNHMGAGAPGFTEQALRFHHTADRISEAARARDTAGVLSALDATLATCTGCHAVFKQRVVDEATWTSLVGTAAPQHH
jgi:cytochrome c556